MHSSFKTFPLNCLWRAIGCLFIGLLVVGCEKPQSSEAGSNQTVAGTVVLEVDFRSDRETIRVDVPCSADSTVFSILQRAQNMGDLTFESRGGEPTTYFVTSIGGVENLASAGDNWVYRVNDKLGDKSCGVFPVKPGDHVLWVFGKYP